MDDDQNKRSTYVYKDPRDAGYILTRIKKRHLQKIGLPSRRGNSFVGTAEVYWHPERGYILQYFTRGYIKVLITLLFPIVALLYGVVNIQDLLRDYKRLWNERKCGAFSSDNCWPGDKFCSKLDELRKSLG